MLTSTLLSAVAVTEPVVGLHGCVPSLNKGLCPTNAYVPGESESLNRPSAPTDACPAIEPSALVAATSPLTGLTGASPTFITSVPVTVAFLPGPAHAPSTNNASTIATNARLI